MIMIINLQKEINLQNKAKNQKKRNKQKNNLKRNQRFSQEKRQNQLKEQYFFKEQHSLQKKKYQQIQMKKFLFLHPKMNLVLMMRVSKIIIKIDFDNNKKIPYYQKTKLKMMKIY